MSTSAPESPGGGAGGGAGGGFGFGAGGGGGGVEESGWVVPPLLLLLLLLQPVRMTEARPAPSAALVIKRFIRFDLPKKDLIKCSTRECHVPSRVSSSSSLLAGAARRA